MPAAREHFRAHARRRVNLGATLRDNVGSLVKDVRVRDLGLGGACLEIADPHAASSPSAGGAAPVAAATLSRWLDPEAIVIVELAAPTRWDPLTLHGKIAWVRRGSQGRPTRAGVRFEHRDAGMLFALFQLLAAAEI
jgi:hypothetical protein